MCYLCLNTQPPEGGWLIAKLTPTNLAQFQHTAARRRLGCNSRYVQRSRIVSTHSRPKAAGVLGGIQGNSLWVSTHSRPKAAGYSKIKIFFRQLSFNTQPPEGGWVIPNVIYKRRESFNTQPPEGGWFLC